MATTSVLLKSKSAGTQIAKTRIGSFSNPKTKEEDWLGVEKIPEITFLPKDIYLFGDSQETSINFRCYYTPEDETISMVAEYKINNDDFESDPIVSKDDLIATQVCRCVYEDTELDDNEVFAQLKNSTFENLSNKLIIAGHLVDHAKMDGMGFIVARNKRVGTFTNVEFDIQRGRNTMKVTLGNCVSSANINNLMEPHIEFYANDKRYNLNGFAVVAGTEQTITPGVIKFQVEITGYQTVDAVGGATGASAIELNPKDETSVEAFVQHMNNFIDKSDISNTFDFADIL